MMATLLEPSSPLAALRPKRSTRGSAQIQPWRGLVSPNRCTRREALHSRRSADLAGRSPAASRDIPVLFDCPLAPHHKLIGQWVAARTPGSQSLTRPEARRHIERVFSEAVHDVLGAIDMVDLRTVVLHGHDHGPPAIAIICDSLGQLDLGWIETGDAPIRWRAAIYKALGETLRRALPIFGYDDLFEDVSMYYWEGETDDESARQSMIDMYGPDEIENSEMTLPSTMNARRPEWMISANAARPSRLPARLRQLLSELHDAHDALAQSPRELNAWDYDIETVFEYVPGIEECATLPPLTLVPFDQFARELDDVGRHGMEMGFMDFCGLCPLPDADRIDDWFATLRAGARFLASAQALLQFDPARK